MSEQCPGEEAAAPPAWGSSHFGVACCLADLAWFSGDMAQARSRLESLKEAAAGAGSPSRSSQPLQQARLWLQSILCSRQLCARAARCEAWDGARVLEEEAKLNRDIAAWVRGMVESGNTLKLAWTAGMPRGSRAASGVDFCESAARPQHVPLTWNELLIQGLGVLIDTSRVANSAAPNSCPFVSWSSRQRAPTLGANTAASIVTPRLLTCKTRTGHAACAGAGADKLSAPGAR